MTHFAQVPAGDEAARPVLKLHEGKRERRDLSPDMTWPEFYRAFYRPFVLVAQGASPRTLEEYDQSIDYWEAFTHQPTLRTTDDVDIADFMQRALALPGKKKGELISPNTVRKHCTHLQAVMIKAGPRSYRRNERKAQRLIAEVPWFEKPREREKEAEDDFTLEEVSQMMAHCDAAVAPEYLSAEQRVIFYRTLFSFDLNVGLRIGSVLLVAWDGFRQDARGWWVYVKVKRDHTKRFFCNTHAMAAVERMRPITGAHEHVWHFPHGQHWLQEQRRRILEKAGIPEHRRFGFHGLRKAMCTNVSESDPLAAQMQAGQSNFEVTQKHYINPKRVATAMEQLAQPKVPTRQRNLFE